MKRLFQHLFLFCTLSLLSLSARSQPASDDPSSISRFNAVRINDRLNVMVAIPGKDGGAMQIWQAYDCKKPYAEALYRHLVDAEGTPQGRFYGNEYGRYRAPQPGPNQDPAVLEKICGLPELSVVWEKIDSADKFGATTLIDVASLKREAETLRVRVGTDYAATDFDPPYDAPYSLKVENYRFNCKTGASKPLSAMDVDDKGYVTDSLDGGEMARRSAAFSLSPLLQETFVELCKLPEVKTFHALGRFRPASHKSPGVTAQHALPDLGGNPASVLASVPLAPDLLQQVKAIVHPWATPRFRQISWVETSRAGRVSVQMVADEAGFIRKLEDYGIWKVQRLSIANDVQLASAMSISNSPARLKQLSSTLRYPLTAGQQYQNSAISEGGVNKGEESYQRETCEVSSGGEAREINPAFSGRYLQVICKIASDKQPLIISHNAWLEDLRLLAPVSAKVGDKPLDTITLTDVKIVR
ncbi:hypothetical protein [Pantoea sp. AS142]|uniref:hypothetical protein n=1 Tax=Pantoea sp. AS142 TaxID=3081292 RepID=UPI003016D370